MASYLLDERFWSKVDKTETCWLWLASKDNHGYGHFKVSGKGICRAHRVAYEALVGPIPDGLVIDHLCRNRACVNPAHLEPVTQQENILRGDGMAAVFSVSATHCPQGHPYTGDNLQVYADGKRRCRACRRKWQADWAREKRRARKAAGHHGLDRSSGEGVRTEAESVAHTG